MSLQADLDAALRDALQELTRELRRANDRLQAAVDSLPGRVCECHLHMPQWDASRTTTNRHHPACPVSETNVPSPQGLTCDQPECRAMRALVDEALILDPPVDLADWKRWAKHVTVCLPDRYRYGHRYVP